MSFSLQSQEDFNIYHSEGKPWEGQTERVIDDLEGSWVNADSPSEHYCVEGHRVTRTDIRGTHHFTLKWDTVGQRWQWGTHGRLSLEWVSDDVISWIPDVHARHTKVWHWQRTGPRPTPLSRRGGVASLALALPPSNYGPSRRPRSNHQNWAQPYSTPSSPWCMTTSGTVPPGNPFAGSGVQPLWVDGSRGWDFIDESQAYHQCHHDSRYQREYNHYRDYHGHHNWRSRSGGYSEFCVSLPCGLTTGEVSDLLSRDITPEDYDLLLRLDKEVPKPTASVESIDGLPAVATKEFMGGECTVCLSKFEADDKVVALPCNHRFHRSCVTKWLSECRRMCPLCGLEVLPAAEAAPSAA